MRTCAVALVAAVLSGCGPNPKAPVKVMAVVPSSAGTYQTQQVELKTITDVTALKGTVAQLVGGCRVVVDANDPMQSAQGGIQNMTDAQRYEVIVRDKGADVRGDYIDRAGVLWPADFHTWNMVTTYYNFEQAFFYFQGVLAADPPELQNLRVMYWPEVHLNSTDALVDNALYLSFIKSFVVVPQQTQQQVPLAMNLGVIGHEMAHKVFSKRALEDQGIAPVLLTWNLVPFNLLKSLDEGLADFHGFGVTCLDPAGCRPNFLSVSWNDASYASMRDVSRSAACMDATLRNAFRSYTPDQWVRSQELYKVGNLIAAILYQSANKAGKLKLMQRAVIAAYDDESPVTPGLRQLISRSVNTQENFTPEAVMNVFAAHLGDPDLKKSFCNEATDRLQLSCLSFPCAELPDCPATSARGATCPVLPQP